MIDEKNIIKTEYIQFRAQTGFKDISNLILSGYEEKLDLFGIFSLKNLVEKNDYGGRIFSLNNSINTSDDEELI